MKMLLRLAAGALLAGMLVATAIAAPHEAIVIQREVPSAQKQDAQVQKQDAQVKKQDAQVQKQDVPVQKKDAQVQKQEVQAQKPVPGEKSVKPAPKKPDTSMVERYDKRREIKKRAAEKRKELMIQGQQNKKNGT